MPLAVDNLNPELMARTLRQDYRTRERDEEGRRKGLEQSYDNR